MLRRDSGDEFSPVARGVRSVCDLPKVRTLAGAEALDKLRLIPDSFLCETELTTSLSVLPLQCNRIQFVLVDGSTNLYLNFVLREKRLPPVMTAGISFDEVIVKKYFCSTIVRHRLCTACVEEHL